MDTNPVKILIVEEDPIQRDLIAMVMKRMDCVAITACNAQEAIELFLSHRPQVALIDIFLSQKNGLDLLKSLKRNPAFSGCRVIIISALGFPEVVNRAIDLGAEDFLVKPLDSDVLMSRMSTLLSRLNK
ncbi:MAG TPA: response regulator [Anaerolineaceae bacterium]|nr:response regulator [Anaerolineaceae bacterium]